MCLQETKTDVIPAAWAAELMGTSFDYYYLPSRGASGGILLAWRTDRWHAAEQCRRRFSVTACLTRSPDDPEPWWLMVVYGPVVDVYKPAFLDEFRATRLACAGPWLVVGDFNMIYQASNKSNDKLNLRAMHRFRRTLDAIQPFELYLHGCRFTWSNERRHPTFERIDMAFASVSWLEAFSCHHLRSLATECSDHARLLLDLCIEPWVRPRFRFETIWVRFDGFLDAVRVAWVCTFLNVDQVDNCRVLDFLLRKTARALKS